MYRNIARQYAYLYQRIQQVSGLKNLFLPQAFTVSLNIDNRSFRDFFSTSEEAVSSSKRISINTVGKTALKYGNLPSLTMIRPKRAKILPHKVANVFSRLLRGGGGLEEERTCSPP